EEISAAGGRDSGRGAWLCYALRHSQRLRRLAMELDLYRLFRKPSCFVAMAGIHVIAESGMTTGGFMARARGIARIRRTPRRRNCVYSKPAILLFGPQL